MIVGKFYPPRYPLFDFQQSSQVSNLTYTNRISFMTVLAFDISLKTTTVTAKVCNLLPHFSTHPIQPQPSSKKHQSPSPRSPQPNISTLQLPQKKILDLFGCCCHFETKCFFIKGGSICCRHRDDVLLGGMEEVQRSGSLSHL